MGHVLPDVEFSRVEAGIARYHAREQTLGLGDPVRKVSAAVREVLAGFAGSPSIAREPAHQTFLEGLFSVRDVETLPPGTRSARIPAGTVVTPLAQERLNRRGIEISRIADEDEHAAASGEWAFAISAESEVGTVMALRRSLLEGAGRWAELEPSIDRVTDWLSEKTGRGAMFVTFSAALTVWRACQVRGVRAASAGELADVHRAAVELGMNLLVIEPAGKSIHWMKQMGRAFQQTGAPRVPARLLGEDQP
jgi:hypothetical protein